MSLHDLLRPKRRRQAQHRAPCQARALTPTECEAEIAAHDEARLGYQTGCGPRAVVVPYTLRDHEVLLVLPEYHPGTGHVIGSRVTLDVEATAPRTTSRVHVSGVAYEGDDAEARRLQRPGATWPPGVRTRAVHIPLSDVEGERVAAGARR